ncbi:hypothetical protein C5167_039868, partial [Papaver somniferum]
VLPTYRRIQSYQDIFEIKDHIRESSSVQDSDCELLMITTQQQIRLIRPPYGHISRGIMVTIPDDIISDILVRLPVKSIGRFRCVSKAWCKLLKGSEFVKMHLNYANEMNKFNILHHNFSEFHTIGYDPLPSSTCSDLVSTVNCPLLSDDYRGFKFWGSSDGLVCLTYCNAWVTNPPKIVAIWNPCTNECKKLPISPSENPSIDYHQL